MEPIVHAAMTHNLCRCQHLKCQQSRCSFVTDATGNAYSAGALKHGFKYRIDNHTVCTQ